MHSRQALFVSSSVGVVRVLADIVAVIEEKMLCCARNEKEIQISAVLFEHLHHASYLYQEREASMGHGLDGGI